MKTIKVLFWFSPDCLVWIEDFEKKLKSAGFHFVSQKEQKSNIMTNDSGEMFIDKSSVSVAANATNPSVA